MREQRQRPEQIVGSGVEASLARVGEWRANPSQFCEEVLGFKPWDRQAEMIAAAADHSRVACRSGQKTGKSRGIAALCVWNAVCWPGSRSFITEPSYDQIKLVLWRELKALKLSARVELGGELHKDPSTGWTFPAIGSEIVGRSTNEMERWAGLSCAGRMLFVIDEASGIPEFVYEAIEGNMAGGAWMFLTSQPLRTSGQFYRAFHGERSIWHCLSINAEESPNCREDAEHIPGLATPEWIEERRKVWGADSNLYRVRVEGDFPTADDNALIPLINIEEAIQRGTDARARGALPTATMYGVDVSGGTGRDAAVIAPANGSLHIGDLEHSRNWDPMHLAGRCVQLCRAEQWIRIDADGMGAPLVGLLRERGISVEAYHGSATCEHRDRSGELEFLNRRAYAWWALRERLDPNIGDGMSLPNEPELVEDLQAPKWHNTSTGKVQLEPKAGIAARIGRSPDMGDAVVMAALRAPGSDMSWVSSMEGASRGWV